MYRKRRRFEYVLTDLCIFAKKEAEVRGVAIAMGGSLALRPSGGRAAMASVDSAADASGSSTQATCQLLILQLLSEKPSYGYELIKSIEERLSGGYAPSPGVVYPTLTLLEERGFAKVVEPSEGGRKTYAITDAGIARSLRRTKQGFARLRSGWSTRGMRSVVAARRRLCVRSAILAKLCACACFGVT